MQKTFLTAAALLAFALNAMGQGQLTFRADNTSGYITYSLNGVTTTPFPLNPGLATYGNASVGFFVAPSGTQLTLSGGLPDFTSVWTPLAGAGLPVALGGGAQPGPGVAFDATVPVTTAGNPLEIEVVAWTGTFTSWSAAVTAGDALLGYSGETFNGSAVGALGWSQPVPSSGPPQTLVTGSQGFLGIVLVKPIGAPEPSTFAIGGLGLGVLALVRRLRNRK